MQVRCLHCHEPLEVTVDLDLSELCCASCGGSFSLLGDDTVTYAGTRARSLGHFDLIEQVGSGSFGSVWKARDKELDRTVAVKIPRKGQLGHAEAGQFLREARAAAQLNHPNIVSVHEVGRDEDTVYIVSDFVEGTNLGNWLTARRLTPREAAQLCASLADALDHAHKAGVVHRDVKPGNVMIDLEGKPHLMDFGLARRQVGDVSMTIEGRVIGTPSYMSPEQARGEGHTADHRTDIYSLGVILFRLLTGELPFRGDPQMLIVQILRDEPPSPRKFDSRIPRDLETITLKCQEKNPDKRFQTAGELAAELRRYLDGEPIKARPLSRSERYWRWSVRNPVVAGLTAAVALLLIAVAMGSTLAAWRLNNAAIKESRLRRAAQEASRKANEEAHRADAAAKESRRQLVNDLVASGQRLMDEDDLLGSLGWFVRALEQVATEPDADPATVEIHRMRVAAVLRRCPKLQQVWFHGRDVHTAEFSRDGRRVVTASNDGTAQVWDTATGDPVGPALQHRDQVGQACFSPDGRLVVTASSDGTARIWNASTGAPSGPPLQHPKRVIDAAFSPDGHRVVTCSSDHTARVWDVATGKPVTPPLENRLDEAHASIRADETNHYVVHASFSPDSSKVVTAGNDSIAQVWDAARGTRLTPPLVHGSQVNYAIFSPDGQHVLTACNDHSARIWDSRTGQLTTRPLKHTEAVHHASFSPDGTRVVTASADETARVWDSRTGELIAPVMKHKNSVNHVVFSPDGRRVLTASADGTARVWDAGTGIPVTPPLRHSNSINQATFSPDGRRVLTASQDESARLWDLSSADTLVPELKLTGLVEQASFSPDGRWVVICSHDRMARVWDAATGLPVSPAIEHKFAVNSVMFSPDGRAVLTASGNDSGPESAASGIARIWDAASGQPISLEMEHHAGIDFAAYSPDGRRVVTGAMDGTARVWDAATAAPITPILKHKAAHRVHFAAFSPNGRRVVTAAFDGTARVWDAESGQPVTPFLEHADCDFYHASFSPDGALVVTAISGPRNSEGFAQIWNAQTGAPVGPRLDHNSAYVFRAVFSNDGRLVLTAGSDQTAQVWDVATGRRARPPLRHSGVVHHAEFSPDGRRIVTSSWDRTARVWDAASSQPITPLLPHLREVQHASFSPDGLRLVTSSNVARIWELSPDPRPIADLISLAMLLTTRQFESSGGFVPLDHQTAREIWSLLRSRYPGEFASTPAQVFAWHLREAGDCESEKAWSAALFHLNQLIASKPADQGLQARRTRIRAKLVP